MLKKSLGIFLAVIFLLIGVLTLSDYGLNVDESIHFNRGQAFLRYLLTGKKDYSDLPSQPLHRGLLDDKIVETKKEDKRSLFQSSNQDMNWFFLNEPRRRGHPASSDVLAALTNVVFFQKLKVLGDLEAHHLFSLAISAFLVFLIFVFAQEAYGGIAGLAAALALATYPLFLGESRFNVKDPPEAFFYTATLFTFWKGVKEKKAKYFLLSAFFFGWAMGTKFNIFFLAFTILPWLLILFWKNIRRLSFKIPKKIIWALLAAPFIIGFIFFGTNPSLWNDLIDEFLKIVNYYRKIGGFAGARSAQPGFLWRNINFYPILTVFYTTPLVTLSFSIIGILVAFWRWRKEKYKTSLLIFLWFLVPVLRVTIPSASIYGGLRQIMEYIPAMAVLAGLGAESLRKLIINNLKFKIKNKKNCLSLITYYLLLITFCFSFLPITIKMIRIHPNQNVYFNPLIGGLAGAAQKNYPYYSDTMGNVYLQGIKWMNKNAEENVKLALPIGNITNLPWIKIREDIRFNNGFTSFIIRLGEYVMDTFYQDKMQNYRTWYYRRYLDPVYEVKVEGVPLLKIWKNDEEHLRPGFLTTVENKPQLSLDKEEGMAVFDFGKIVVLERFSLNFKSSYTGVLKDEDVKTFYSVDGKDWHLESHNAWKLYGWVTQYSDKAKNILEGYDLVPLFAARKARFLKIKLPAECLGKIDNWEAQILADFVNLPYSLEENQLVFSGEINQPGEYFLVSLGSKLDPFDTPFVQEPLFEIKDKFFQIGNPVQLGKGNFSFAIPFERKENLLRNPYFDDGIESWSGGEVVKDKISGENSLLIKREKKGKSFVYQKSIPKFEKEAIYLISFDYKLLRGEAAIGIWQPPHADYPQNPELLTKPSNQWQHGSFLLRPETGTNSLDFYLYSFARDEKGAEVLFRNLSVEKFTLDGLPRELWLIKKYN